MSIRCWKAAAVTLMASTAFAGVAFAQTAPAPDSGATTAQGDIIVTAQRRSESIQRVPISMQALSPTVLAQHQVQNFDDYTKLLPVRRRHQ